MAVSVYYGTCTTIDSTPQKVVRIKDSEITTNDFDFGMGDLLVVYFSNLNTADTPSLVIINGDTEEEVSTSNDSGKFIKIKSIEEIEDPTGLWDSGETVIFAYTKNISNNDNNYYWELIDAARASEVISGVTKLYGNANTNISEWLAGTLKEEDFNKALTPGILKKFYQLLIGKEEEQGSASAIQLNWVPSITDQELTNLGKLSLSVEEGSGIDINFPLDSYIDGRIGTKISKTSDIINDGPDPTKANKTANGQFYITNVIPEDKSLYFKKGNNNVFFLQPNSDSNNCVLRGQNRLILQGQGDGVYVEKYVNDTHLPTLFSVLGNIRTTNNGTITAAGKMYEKGEALNQRYCGAYKIKTVTTPAFTMAKNTQSGHRYINASKETGFSPVGILGVNLNYAGNDTGDATWCFIWEYSLNRSTGQIQYAVRNTNTTKTVKIEVVFTVLYFRNVT